MQPRLDIQGLRGIAVLAVIIFHFNPKWLPGGFIGVDIFLVISGFLITSILLREKERNDHKLSNTLAYFYNSRIKRIVPAYFIMLIVVALTAAIFLLPQDFQVFKKGLEKASWFNSNNYFSDFGDYFSSENHEQPLLHTWSLAIEIQFYLIAPFIILLIPVKFLKWILAALLITLTLIAEYRLRILGLEQETYYSLYSRLPEFFSGSLAALYRSSTFRWRQHHWLNVIGLFLIAFAIVIQPNLGVFPGASALLPVAGVVILLMNTQQGLVSRFLTNKILIWVGAISYSLYLWHWPVLAFLRYYTNAEVLDLDSSILFVVLTLVLSLTSYYLIENKFRIKDARLNQGVRWLFLFGLILGTSRGIEKINFSFTPEQLPIEYQRYADPKNICHGIILSGCFKGDLQSDEEILVLGDSHAAMLNNTFDKIGLENKIKFEVITGSSCITILDFDYKVLPEWAQPACELQIEAAMSRLNDYKYIIIAGMWSYHTSTSDIDMVIARFLEKNPKKIFLFLGQIPELERNPRRARRLNALYLPVKTGVSSDFVNANFKISMIANRYSNVTFLDLSGSNLFDTVPVLDGELIYFDESHLNQVGAGYYSRVLNKPINEFIREVN